jgi:uncharacterized protein YbjT (DUF2867 family)
MTETTVLVTGSTGRSGRRVAHLLHDRGIPTRRASRSAPQPFDWHDRATWPAILDGCTAAYLCYSPDLAFPGVDAVIAEFTAAAVARGVRRLVLLSGRGEAGARRCEDIVLGAPVAAVVVRCAWFQENFSEHFLRDGVLTGRIAMPAGAVTEPFVSLDDVAEVAVRALTTGGLDGRILELTGPESIGFERAASILSAALEREIVYQPVDVATFVGEAEAAGLDRADAEGLGGLVREVLDGRNQGTTDTVRRVVGRPATTFQQYARRAAAAGAWSPAGAVR